jgi:hypothetical protein
MAQPWSTGATHAYISDAQGQPLYLGTTESQPGQDISRQWDATMNDISGSKNPFEQLFSGIGIALVSLVLTRWNQPALNALRSFPGPAAANPEGFFTLNDVGALAGLEGYAFKTWIAYQFGPSISNKAAYAGMEPGRMYPQCIVWGPDRTETGTRAKKEHLIILAWPKYAKESGTFQLYSTAQADFSGLPPPD